MLWIEANVLWINKNLINLDKPKGVTCTPNIPKECQGVLVTRYKVVSAFG